MQRRFLKYSIWFFAPVILGYLIIEILTLNLPMSYKSINSYLQSNKDEIQVIVLGSSQMKNAVNPAYLDQSTLNIASGNQHFDTDFKILKELVPKLPKLETVVLEVSYSHFELPLNGKNFWKNNIYLKYYNVNAFERPTYFKDKLIFISHPPFFSEKLIDFYFLKNNSINYNRFGFDINDFSGTFKDLNYNKKEIQKVARFKINTTPNLIIYHKNTTQFFELLNFLKKEKLNIIICKPPMHKRYLQKRNFSILKRRDSIIDILQKKYPEILLLDEEEDTARYQVSNYKNQSHLNPTGALIFTKKLNGLINKID